MVYWGPWSLYVAAFVQFLCYLLNFEVDFKKFNRQYFLDPQQRMQEVQIYFLFDNGTCHTFDQLWAVFSNSLYLQHFSTPHASILVYSILFCTFIALNLCKADSKAQHQKSSLRNHLSIAVAKSSTTETPDRVYAKVGMPCGRDMILCLTFLSFFLSFIIFSHRRDWGSFILFRKTLNWFSWL